MDNQNILLQKLKDEINWQWKWEKLNRHFFIFSSWITWVCSVLVLGLAGYQLHLGDHPRYSVTLVIAILSSVIMSLPVLCSTLKWERRQHFHDRLAREYEVIKLKLEINQINVPEAVEQFEKLHKNPPEVAVLTTP